MADHYTKVPNWFFKKVLNADLTASELKVLLYIVRMTWGYQKDNDKLSSSMIAEHTGLHRVTVVNAIKKLEKDKYISVKRRKKQGQFYDTNNIKILGGGSSLQATGGSSLQAQNSVVSRLQYPSKGKYKPLSDGCFVAPSSGEKKYNYDELNNELGEEYE